MERPRIFLGSSAKQAKVVQALTRRLADVARVEPWTTTFNPGSTTLDRLFELAHEVDFAALLFAQDDWTATASSDAGQAAPRDNVVFEAGLFGGVLGMRRTFIVHARGAKLPTDLLGLTSVRYDDAGKAAELKRMCEKLRGAIEAEGRLSRIEGHWWQFSLTERSKREPSAVSLLSIRRDHDGMLEVSGHSWQQGGMLSARYRSQAARELKEPQGVFYFWRGERPRQPNSPQLEGTGEIRLESADRAAGWWTTRAESGPDARTSGIYLRADEEDVSIVDGLDDVGRAPLIADRLQRWKSLAEVER